MEPVRITVVCDDAAHDKTIVDRLELYKGKVGRVQERHHARLPAHTREDLAYDRIRLRCERCGLDVQMRQETAQRMIRALLDAGRGEVHLTALARSV